MKEPLRIGILYPLHSAEDDYPRLAAAIAPPVKVHVVHTESLNLHQIEASRVTGSREYLLSGAEVLRNHAVDVCMWACTSGSFPFGLAGAKRQAQDIADALGVPASSTSLAFLSAPMCLALSAFPLRLPIRKTWQMHFGRFWLKAALRLCIWVA